jgi:hypothetical protein
VNLRSGNPFRYPRSCEQSRNLSPPFKAVIISPDRFPPRVRGAPGASWGERAAPRRGFRKPAARQAPERSARSPLRGTRRCVTAMALRCCASAQPRWNGRAASRGDANAARGAGEAPTFRLERRTCSAPLPRLGGTDLLFDPPGLWKAAGRERAPAARMERGPDAGLHPPPENPRVALHSTRARVGAAPGVRHCGSRQGCSVRFRGDGGGGSCPMVRR